MITMKRDAVAGIARTWLFALLGVMAAAGAQAAAVSELIGERLRDLRGETVGAVQELIVDVREGRVLYIIVEAPQRFLTLPVGALDERLRLDMSLAGSAAQLDAQADPRFRRAGRLLGQALEHTGGERIGVIRDIEFDPGSGEVERVVVHTDQGARDFPASVLAYGRFPPLTRWQAERPSPEVEDKGFVVPPSGERRSLQDPEWDTAY
jgi:sporulation protein YlmC with PRC-barrel domain